MSPRKLITAEQVAEILGYGSVAYFKRVHRSLEKKGFPKPFRRYPLLWDPAAIAAYQDALLPGGTISITIDPVDREATRLTKRLEAMA